MNINREKQQIRQYFTTIRDTVTAAKTKEEQIKQNFIAYLTNNECDINYIAGYYPIKSEVNILPLLHALSNLGKTICLPKINVQHQLKFYYWHPTQNSQEMLRLNDFNILEPDNDLEIFPDILITPGLAFDKVNRSRLGYGKGYYDRTITQLKAHGNIFTVGICYEAQLTYNLPIEPHDQKMDIIITEQNIIS